jgi:hypothetical protein
MGRQNAKGREEGSARSCVPALGSMGVMRADHKGHGKVEGGMEKPIVAKHLQNHKLSRSQRKHWEKRETDHEAGEGSKVASSENH